MFASPVCITHIALACPMLISLSTSPVSTFSARSLCTTRFNSIERRFTTECPSSWRWIEVRRSTILSCLVKCSSLSLACNTLLDCPSCLAMRGQRHNCSWCEDIGKCSDGYDRSRQQWIRAGCHRVPSDSVCPNRLQETFEKSQLLSLSTKRTPKALGHPFRTLVLTLFISVLFLSLVVFAGTSIYAYRYPLSPIGMWLVEHRPSLYLARLRRFTASN